MADSSIFAREEALQRVDRDVELLRELVQLFFAEFSQNTASLRTLASRNDNSAFSRVAHSIKGAAGNIGAPTVARLAAQLEQLSLSQAAGSVGSLIEELESAASEFQHVFTESSQRNFTE